MPPADKKPPDAVPKGMTARPDLIGRVLSDRYRVDELIAAGAFGAVYRGAHLHMHKQVAIKVLHPEIEELPGTRRALRARSRGRSPYQSSKRRRRE